VNNLNGVTLLFGHEACLACFASHFTRATHTPRAPIFQILRLGRPDDDMVSRYFAPSVTQKGSGGKQAQVGSPVLLAYLRGSIQYNGVPERTLLAFTANLEMFVVIVRAEFPPWLPVYSESEWGALFFRRWRNYNTNTTNTII
jgi:hypothetical protein